MEAADAEPGTLGERLELLAVVRGLEALDQPSRVTLVTSSKYVHRGLLYGLEEWRSNGWSWEHFGQMVPVKNRDLWQRLDRALAFHELDFRPWRFDMAAPGGCANPAEVATVEAAPVDATLALGAPAGAAVETARAATEAAPAASRDAEVAAFDDERSPDSRLALRPRFAIPSTEPDAKTPAHANVGQSMGEPQFAARPSRPIDKSASSRREDCSSVLSSSPASKPAGQAAARRRRPAPWLRWRRALTEAAGRANPLHRTA